MKENEIDYLKGLYSSAREEFLFHLKQRDEWLKYQLIAQASLFAIVNGIELTFAKAIVPKLEILGFSIIVSLIFGCLYFVEDNLIGYLAKYLARLSTKINKLLDTNESIMGVEASLDIGEYSKKIRPFRDLTSSIIFLVIPLYLGVTRFISVKNWNILTIGELILDIILVGILSILIIKTYQFRRDTGKNPKIQ